MKAGIHRIILPATLTFALCVAIFVSFVPKQAAALSMAPTANSKDQMVVIQKLLEQVKDLQKQLTDTQQAAGEGSGQSSTCLDIKNNFGYQSSDIFTNNEVSAVQKFLQANGYLNIAPTGYYGPLTTEAVKSFQGASGIEASGYVGTQTRAKIKGITCPPAPIVDYINEDTTSSSTDGVINFGDDARYPYTPKPQITLFRLSAETFTRERDTITVNWSTNTSAVNCSIYRKESNGDAYTIASNLGSTTSYVLYAESIGAGSTQAQFVLSCRGNTGGEGSSLVAEKQFTLSIVNVSTSPSCVLTADKSTYTLGDTIKLSWKGTSKNNVAYLAFDTKDSEKDSLQLPGDKLEKSGIASVKASVTGNPTVKLYVYDSQGSSGLCSIKLPISGISANPNSYTLSVGSAVKTMSDLNIRATPSLNGSVLSVAPEGSSGKVVDGPRFSEDLTTWWKVQYANGDLGWSMGKYLTLQNDDSLPTISDISFLNLSAGNSGYLSDFRFVYTIENWKPGIVLDVEPTVHCDSNTAWLRDCSHYLIDLTQKAGETYYGVQGEPYVKGSTDYTFTGSGVNQVINIKSYPDPDHALGQNELTPYADSVTYKLILKDLNNGGTKLWSKEFEAYFKG